MNEPIYFSKIEFIEESISYRNPNSIILLNLSECELSYQVFKWIYPAPTIQGTEVEERYGNLHDYYIGYPAKWISSDKTHFKKKLFKTEDCESSIVFSYGIKLSDEQMKALLPLCNALDFEPFRNKKATMDEDGFCGYRDEISVKFRGITNSYIPLLELSMDFFYDYEHIWPCEKLYHHIIKNIFDKDKNMKGWYTPYGGLSLHL